MQPPPTAAEDFAARHNALASAPKQIAVLVLGMAAAGVIAATLGSVSATTNPIWVLPVLASGFVCFFGLLASTAWSMRATVTRAEGPVISAGIYLTCVLLTGAVTAYLVDTPPAAYLTPLLAAAAFAALTVFGRIRRRSRAAQIERLRSGAHAMGTVTDDGLAAFATTPNLKIVKLAVSFPDQAGTTRWVNVSAMQAPAQPIAVGQHVDVWFDASAPEDASRIVVQYDNGASRIV